MDIEKLDSFAADGERSKAGLNPLLGFPRYEKPARQWFNYLFHEFTEKLNVLVQAVNDINNKPEPEPYAIGDVYITTINLADEAAVAAHHGYGVWARYGEGRTLVGYSTQSGSPTWTKTIGSIHGDYEHKLKTSELPSSAFKLRQAGDHGAREHGGGGTGYASATTRPLESLPSADTGWEDAPHNNVQPSLVAQFWLRVS